MRIARSTRPRGTSSGFTMDARPDLRRQTDDSCAVVGWAWASFRARLQDRRTLATHADLIGWVRSQNPAVQRAEKNPDVVVAIAAGANLVAGTLFINEAGQTSLANAVAV